MPTPEKDAVETTAAPAVVVDSPLAADAAPVEQSAPQTSAPAAAPTPSLRDRVIAATLARTPSDELAVPPKIALVEFTRKALLAVLEPVKDKNHRARDLYAGVFAVHKGKTVNVQREHLLIALGELPEDEEPENEPDNGNPGPAAG